MSNAGVIKTGSREYRLFTEEDWYQRQNKRAAVAYNWNRKLFSVRARPGGKVIGYTKEISLVWAEFSVDYDKAGKIMAGGNKTLHAYVCGDIYAGDLEETFGKYAHALRYNPRENPYFVIKRDGGWRMCTGATGIWLRIKDGKPQMTAYVPEVPEKLKLARATGLHI